MLGNPQLLLLVSELPPSDGAICTDLLTLIEKRGRLTEADARQIFVKLTLAVKRAHDQEIVLRNIKPEGIQVRAFASFCCGVCLIGAHSLRACFITCLFALERNCRT